MPLTLIQPLSLRVLSRLEQVLSQEPNPWIRDDLHIAKLTVLYAARGDAVECSPHVLASYEVLGLHPEKVWPAIEARRNALGPLDVVARKKPPQSVKLWFEKANAARATNSRGVEAIGSLRTSIPSMATASIAALYPNPDAPSSAKKRGYTYDEMLAIVQYSGAEHSVRAGTLAALRARGPWPNQDGSATGVICISLIGMTIEGGCCRSTARYRARRAVKRGYWRELRDANSWSDCPKCQAKRNAGKCEKCGYQGRAKTPDGKANFDEFCRPFMYEIDIEKFRSAQRPKEIRHFDARTYAEYKEAAKRGDHRNLVEMPSHKPVQPTAPPPPKSPAPAAPLPKQPAAEHEERQPLPITRDVRIAIAGCYTNARKKGHDDEAALAIVSESLSSERYYLAPSEARLQLKIWQSKHGSIDPPGKQEWISMRCPDCQSVLTQNRGPGPRLICPKCSKGS